MIIKLNKIKHLFLFINARLLIYFKFFHQNFFLFFRKFNFNLKTKFILKKKGNSTGNCNNPSDANSLLLILYQFSILRIENPSSSAIFS